MIWEKSRFQGLIELVEVVFVPAAERESVSTVDFQSEGTRQRRFGTLMQCGHVVQHWR